ncbi:MAG: 2'-5' RNA ligase family protein [Propionibacteriaceae bacterium]|nr:2'-5' RNA ligase family protein [Propionibacteriaceae bacterium]
MAQSVELLLDSATEELVHREWVLLKEAGLPTELRSSPAEHHRPHITLFAGSAISEEAEQELPALMVGLDLRVQIGALMFFGPLRQRFVAVHQVVATVELLELQSRVARVCGAEAAGQFAPGRWTSHVTLARRVSSSEVAGMVSALGSAGAVDRVAMVRACRRWDGSTRTAWLL